VTDHAPRFSDVLSRPRRALLLTAVCGAVIAAATAGHCIEKLPAEVQARTGKPLPAPLHTSVAHSDFGMVASGSPEATDAGVRVLESGGNAVDAAVAAALMLGVADPDASGLGGMTYMIVHLAGGRTVAIDGTAPTPGAVDPARLHELKEMDQLVGHELAAVPTTLAVLEFARARYGTMEMAELVRPALEVAETGFRVNPAQIVWTNVYYESILRSGYLRLVALGDNTLIGRPADEDVAIGLPGVVRCRPDLARTLQRIQREGAASFYRGSIADQIEADMLANGGFIRKTDLAMLRIRETQPLHSTYRGRHIITFPPPGGGPVISESLNILEVFPPRVLAEDSVRREQVLIEALRIAFADRLASGATPDGLVFSSPDFLSKEHARRRALTIAEGLPIPDTGLRGPVDRECAPTGDSTTQLSVADARGNVVTLTQTLGRSYGAEVATPELGFPYNSLLESFNFDKPQCPGYLQPRVRCPSDMAPTIILSEDGDLLAALGAPSSSRIPAIITGVISNLVDRGMGLVEAVEAPRVLAAGMSSTQVSVEIAGPITASHVDSLESMGYAGIERMPYPPTSRRIVLFGGVNAVGWDAEAMTFVGVGDGRRWGSARGPAAVSIRTPGR
jgi:gamma-glutamyltranspeptidase/glutathione hydrolase